MKKLLIAFAIYLSSVFITAGYAGGGITHMFLAKETIAQLPDQQLRNLLQDNLDAYLVGAYYPDSGYVGGNHYGEDSHWDPFIYAFADYIKETYPNPAVQNPKLVAFLFGCATHRVSDENMHWVFYSFISQNDFHRPWDWDSTIHGYGDVGIDLLVSVDKDQWLTQPTTWWVPVRDLVQVYHRMGKDEYTDKEIIWGNMITSFAGYAERLIAAPSYPYLKWKLAWTSQHYYDWPEGGLLSDESKSTTYLMALWARLNDKKLSHSYSSYASLSKPYDEHQDESETVDFAKKAIQNGLVDVNVTHNPDGSVEIQSPVIKSFIDFQQMLVNLSSKFIK